MLTLFKPTHTEDVRPVTEDLQEELVVLLKYGHPRISHHKGGWYCHVEMNTNTVGSKFDISSEFNHETPLSALKQCKERIDNTLKQIGK
jgi:hypothetical protein